MWDCLDGKQKCSSIISNHSLLTRTHLSIGKSISVFTLQHLHLCGGMSNSSLLTPISMSWSWESVNDNLSGKRDFEDVINLMIMGRSPGIIWVDPKCNHKCPYKKEAEDELTIVGEKEMWPQNQRLITHNAIYRWCGIDLYTWNLYNFINQCYPNKFSNFC